MKKQQTFYKQKHNWFLGLLMCLLIVSGPMYLIPKITKYPGQVMRVFTVIDGKLTIEFIGWVYIVVIVYVILTLIKGVTLLDLLIISMLYYVVHFTYQNGYINKFSEQQPCTGTFQLQINQECQQMPINIEVK